MRERERLITRVRQIRRTAEPADEPAAPPAVNPERHHIRALEARIAHLELLLHGLRDSVRRESSRHTKRLVKLEARVQPAASAAQ